MWMKNSETNINWSLSQNFKLWGKRHCQQFSTIRLCVDGTDNKYIKKWYKCACQSPTKVNSSQFQLESFHYNANAGTKEAHVPTPAPSETPLNWICLNCRKGRIHAGETTGATVVNLLTFPSRFPQWPLCALYLNAISFSFAVPVINIASTDESSVTATSTKLIQIIDNILMHDLWILRSWLIATHKVRNISHLIP